jgi:hypothetical protein
MEKEDEQQQLKRRKVATAARSPPPLPLKIVRSSAPAAPAEGAGAGVESKTILILQARLSRQNDLLEKQKVMIEEMFKIPLGLKETLEELTRSHEQLKERIKDQSSCESHYNESLRIAHRDNDELRTANTELRNKVLELEKELAVHEWRDI